MCWTGKPLKLQLFPAHSDAFFSFPRFVLQQVVLIIVQRGGGKGHTGMRHMLHEPRVLCLQHTGKCHQGPGPGLSLVNLQFSGCSIMAGDGKDFGW